MNVVVVIVIIYNHILGRSCVPAIFSLAELRLRITEMCAMVQ